MTEHVRMTRHASLLPLPLAVLGVVTLFAAAAEAKLARSGDAQVSFSATGPAGLSIVGTTRDLVVAEAGDDVVVTVPLANLDTKIELRNRHMRDKYLEVARYPSAELRVARSAVAAPSGKATGRLTLHGRTRPVVFTYAARPEGSAVAVRGSLRLNMLEFGIDKPGYAGITVKPDVDVNVSFVAKED